MRYAVEGVNPSTRGAALREINADNEQDAVRQARLQGVDVKKIWRIPDDAPPFRPSAPSPRNDSNGTAPLVAVFCYFMATVSFIATLALAFGVIAPISAAATTILWVLVPGILLLIAGAMFHIIKLLNVIAARTGLGSYAGVSHGGESGASQIKPAPSDN